MGGRHYTGRAPLHWAAEEGHEDTVRLLIENGADIDNRWPVQKPTPHKSPCISHATEDILLIIKKRPLIILT